MTEFQLCQLPQYQFAARLEATLGDPADREQPFCFPRILEEDEREAYPEEFLSLLHDERLHQFHIPKNHGGCLEDLESALAVERVVSRRDLTTTLALGTTILAAMPVWIAGSHSLQKRVAEIIRARHSLAFALSERAHGSDLMASETEATPNGTTYSLSGEKWLIGNATRARGVSVFAKTKPQGGARGFSFMFVDKQGHSSAEVQCLPKIQTLGLRGADISGLRFQQTPVKKDRLIGHEGDALEIGLKTLQVTRTLHGGAGLSLGQADTAMRVTLRFALQRTLYGKPVWEIRHVQQSLLHAFADLLMCDCLAITAARSIATYPEQLSIRSAVLKFLVPTTVEQILARLKLILGARHYLRAGDGGGIFQKLLRDHGIVSVFDGSSVVNLQAIVMQLRQLVDQRTGDRHRKTGVDEDRLRMMFGLDQPLVELNLGRLELHNRGRDDILASASTIHAQLEARKFRGVGSSTLLRVRNWAVCLLDAIEEFDRNVAASIELPANDVRSESAFELARRYCRLSAAATLLNFWVVNSESLGGLQSSCWLEICMAELLRGEPLKLPFVASGRWDELASLLLSLDRDNRMYSVVPVQLGM